MLSKPANLEQIRIVERLESHGSVLVQGPPGTGKTHTIGNLIGHLLAHGKTVLVTADTTKALRVVRDQVDEKLRPLCVSVLDNDLEGRKQLEEAVAVIADEISHEDVDDLRRRATDRARIRRECVEALERARQPCTRRASMSTGQSCSPASSWRRPRQPGRWRPTRTSTTGFPARDEARAPAAERGRARGAVRHQRHHQPARRARPERGAVARALHAAAPRGLRATVSRRGEAPRAARREALVGRSATIGPDTGLGSTRCSSASPARGRCAGRRAVAAGRLARGHAGRRHAGTWDTLLAEIDATEALAERAQEEFVRHAPHVEVLGDEQPLLAPNAELLRARARGQGPRRARVCCCGRAFAST